VNSISQTLQSFILRKGQNSDLPTFFCCIKNIFSQIRALLLVLCSVSAIPLKHRSYSGCILIAMLSDE